jgi:hypothetical protein
MLWLLLENITIKLIFKLFLPKTNYANCFLNSNYKLFVDWYLCQEIILNEYYIENILQFIGTIQSKKELHVSHTETKGIKTKKEIVLILFSWHFCENS